MGSVVGSATRLIDNDGDPMDSGGALKVQLVDSTDNIDIGNVDLMLDGGVPVLGNAGAVAAGVLRVTLASNDPAVVSLDTIDDNTSDIKDAVEGTVDVQIKNASGVGGWTGLEVVQDTQADLKATVYQANDVTVTNNDASDLPVHMWSNTEVDGGGDDYMPIVDGEGHLQVDVLSGTVTANLGSTDNGVLDAIAASLEVLDDWDDSNYANVNLNIAGTDVDGNSGNKSAQSQRIVIATDDVNMSAIKTAVEILDNAISGSEMQVDIVSGSVGHDITGIVSDRDVDVGTTAEKIHTASDVAIKRIDIQAAPANTGYIFVGDGGVAGDGTGGGIRLAAGDFYSLDIGNTGDVYVAASEADEDVYYTYYT